MKSILFTCFLACCIHIHVHGLVTPQPSRRATGKASSSSPKYETTSTMLFAKEERYSSSMSRRTMFWTTVSSAIATTFALQEPSSLASAATTTATSSKIPMISLEEFIIVIRDSARSIERVDIYADARAIVRLLDGTEFGIRDLVESSTDPRSVLKVAAICRENKVPSKFVDLEAALLTSAKTKRKNYANSRVQEAAVREKERSERMQRDEEERLEELRKINDGK